MAYLIGVLLAGVSCGVARLVGFDRERAFYPVMLIVIATYYVLFAVMGADQPALLLELMIASAFTGAAVCGFRSNLWLVVVALASHGVFDFSHSQFFENTGVPVWWPKFCLTFDIAAAIFLGVLLVKRHVRAVYKDAANQHP